MDRKFYAGTWQQERAFSPAVTTRGGRIVWVAGHGGLHGADRPLEGAFEGQARQAFRNVAATLSEAGARLDDLVTMTVFIIDARYGDQFIEVRKEFFPGGNYPASALITVSGFARPSMMVEVQCVAVVPD